jgi:large subunit ribosomal protein L2
LEYFIIMAIKVYNKTTPGRRNMSIVKPEGLTQKKPEKSLLRTANKKSGRSNGTISVRHKGGGHKRRYRVIDFRQDRLGIPATVVALEKDPYRSALIALVQYVDGQKRYVIATNAMMVGKQIIADENAPQDEGNRLKLKNILPGTRICSVELSVGKGAQLVRSAGSSALLMGLDAGRAQIKLASGEVRLVNDECYATIGAISNYEHSSERIGKAGRSRWKRKRPTVRGSAMNPVDHPHGGGEGLQPIGLKYPKSPKGRHALGVKTRKKKRYSDNFIVRRRKKKRR